MKQVKLTIKTTMHKQRETVEQSCYGKWSQSRDSWILMYKENHEGTGEVLTTIKVQNGEATIIRTGAIRMRQEFRMGRWTEGKYEGSFGWMWMKTKMERLQVTEDRFMLDYRLNINDEDLGRYEIQIVIYDRLLEG